MTLVERILYWQIVLESRAATNISIYLRINTWGFGLNSNHLFNNYTFIFRVWKSFIKISSDQSLSNAYIGQGKDKVSKWKYNSQKERNKGYKPIRKQEDKNWADKRWTPLIFFFLKKLYHNETWKVKIDGPKTMRIKE